MIKGIQKNMILVQTPNNRYFESAYFILRHDLSAKEQKENEMIKEANRIIDENSAYGSGQRKDMKKARRLSSWHFSFWIGGAVGAFFTFLISLLLRLIS